MSYRYMALELNEEYWKYLKEHEKNSFAYLMFENVFRDYYFYIETDGYQILNRTEFTDEQVFVIYNLFEEENILGSEYIRVDKGGKIEPLSKEYIEDLMILFE